MENIKRLPYDPTKSLKKQKDEEQKHHLKRLVYMPHTGLKQKEKNRRRAEKAAALANASPSSCPECKCKRYEEGYGLAGGGMGVYKMCVNCSCVYDKVQDAE